MNRRQILVVSILGIAVLLFMIWNLDRGQGLINMFKK